MGAAHEGVGPDWRNLVGPPTSGRSRSPAAKRKRYSDRTPRPGQSVGFALSGHLRASLKGGATPGLRPRSST